MITWCGVDSRDARTQFAVSPIDSAFRPNCIENANRFPLMSSLEASHSAFHVPGFLIFQVYIGPGQYFVTSDIGRGRMQWYSFLALPPGSKKRDDNIAYLKDVSETKPRLLSIQHLQVYWSACDLSLYLG